MQTLLQPLAVAGVEPYATRLKAKPDEIVQMFEPKEINVAVAGGETQGAWKMFGARYEKHPLGRRLALIRIASFDYARCAPLRMRKVVQCPSS